MINATIKGGTAYTVLDLETSREEIQAELPRARQVAGASPQLEVYVRDMAEFIKDKTTDSKLVRCLNNVKIRPMFHSSVPIAERYKVHPKRMADLKYVLEARYTNGTNEQAAAEVTDVARGVLQGLVVGNNSYWAQSLAKAPDGEYHPWTND